MSQLKQTISRNVWFWPEGSKFLMGLVGYFALSAVLTVAVASATGGSIPTLVGSVFFVAIAGSGLFVLLPRILAYDNARGDNSFVSAFFGHSSSVSSSSSQSPAASNGSGPGHRKNDEDERDQIAFERYTKALVREGNKMRKKIFSTGLMVVLALVGFWIISNWILGTNNTPKDIYKLPVWGLFILWFLIISQMSRMMIYVIFFTFAGLTLAIDVFGEAILPVLPQLMMLPLFYGLMMFFMFGSIMYPNIQQQKLFAPGDATWEVPEGSMVGQKEAEATLDTIVRRFRNYATGESTRKPPRGVVMEGPPGTGKTLKAKQIATSLDLPLAFADGSAFAAPFAGFAQLLVHIFRFRVESLAREYGGCLIFVDEGETVYAIRPGMQSKSVSELWDLFPVDASGHIVSGCSLFDTAPAREYARLKSPSGPTTGTGPITNPFMMMGAMGGGGGSDLLPWLTWIDGASSPPMKSRLLRKMGNNFINAVVALLWPIPVSWTIGRFGKSLRFAPAKAQETNLLFMTATNRPEMMDPAIRRHGRLGETARFKNPDIDARVEVANLYIPQLIESGELHADLGTKEKIQEFARATEGMSHATIEAVLRSALDARIQHIETLKRIKDILDTFKESGLSDEKAFEELIEGDRQYWLRHKDKMEQDGWDKETADWEALMDARNSEEHGPPDVGRTTVRGKHKTAYHEIVGHLFASSEFLGKTLRPTLVSVIPRGKTNGMVSNQPIEARDPFSQSDLEGIMRVSVGSLVAEIFCFGEHEPGVVGDLENATRIACFMTGKLAMRPRGCKKDSDDWNYFAKIGRTLIQIPDDAPALSQGAQSFIEKVLHNTEMEERVAVFLGQAAVDVYRLIRANVHLAPPIIEELEKLGEFSGAKLDEHWDALGKNLRSLKDFEGEDRTCFPDRIFDSESPFYTRDKDRKTEMEEVLAS